VKITDKNLPPTLGPRGGKHYTQVDVSSADCLSMKCYHPHRNGGPFTPGRGYTSYYQKPEWVCITRDCHGCPEKPEKKETTRAV
jgi:hypothetical protein